MSLGRNSIYNLCGMTVPTVTSIIVIPFYILSIGLERYGILSIAWLLLGYFGVFNLGMGLAVTQRIASLRSEDPAGAARIFWTGLMLNLGLGLAGGAILWGASETFFEHWMKVDQALRLEVLSAVPLLGLAVPISTTSSLLAGALQGKERFLEINIISASSTIAFQVAPLTVSYLWGANLFWLITAAIAARLLALGALTWCTYRYVLRGWPAEIDRDQIGHLFRFGGWLSAGVIIAPVMVFVDRLAIGALIGAAAVTYYTVPFQLAQRLTILPNAISSALFPRLSAVTGEGAQLARDAVQLIAAVMTPVVTTLIISVHWIFVVWIGHSFALQSSRFAEVFLIGFWANCLAVVPFSHLQAKGRPDLAAKSIILQSLVYLPLLYLVLKLYGVMGACALFSVRCAADFFVLSVLNKQNYMPLAKVVAHLAILLLGLMSAIFLRDKVLLSFIVSPLLVLLAGLASWRTLPANSKARVSGWIGLRSSAGVKEG